MRISAAPGRRSTTKRACFTTSSEATLTSAANEVTFYLAVDSYRFPRRLLPLPPHHSSQSPLERVLAPLPVLFSAIAAASGVSFGIYELTRGCCEADADPPRTTPHTSDRGLDRIDPNVRTVRALRAQ